MGDILKEAIADAKTLRETALENAKIALEEAFTPQLKSMLSAKLREDEDETEVPDEVVPAEENEDEEEVVPAEDAVVGDEEEVAAEEDEEVEVGAEEEGTYEDEEMGDEEVPAEEGEEGEEDLDLEAIIRELEDEAGEEEVAEDEDEEEEVAETVNVNGKQYRLVREEDEAYDEDVEGDEDEKHVGGTIGEADNADGGSDPGPGVEDPQKSGDEDLDEELDLSGLFEEEEEDEDTVEEQSKSSEIGAGDNKVDVADGSDEEDPEGGPGVKVAKLGEELNQYKQAVSFLKDKLHEVNLLNAKLLFTNKLFKNFVLNNDQKLKVVETFDRAQTTREIKLVYSTLAENFGGNSTIKRKSISESASSKSGSTKPKAKKVISEEAQVANRFKKLAGLLND